MSDVQKVAWVAKCKPEGLGENLQWVSLDPLLKCSVLQKAGFGEESGGTFGEGQDAGVGRGRPWARSCTSCLHGHGSRWRPLRDTAGGSTSWEQGAE